ncbi:holocytochrome c synthase [Coemansia sp. RSA 2671]|uniref:Holocytochrome c synthase n=1 Tax=Coemansia linderi TaxID=2663919 RepID=A0ACC1K3P2_9FUNG|nr:holocytochrome c synthase [Coemansia sp. RSA 2675]KAJ2350291.1 holocytochrome c synthase [Coemansia sp. RSA 2671]KAJ2772705.1 holocytochrome c synthase [Coemansia linderi]
MPGDHSDTANSRATCPVNHNASAAVAPHSRPECPVDHTQQQQAPSFAQSLLGSSKKAEAPKCPVDHADGETPAAINPLNMMPQLTQDMHTGQTAPLSTEREFSTIPRSNTDDEAVWEYPSPQQFYNALARKNMAAPEEYVDVMVDIHNFLNEGAWNEVLKWEARHKSECLVPRLARLQGRPRDLSPMARISSWIHGVRPFDRHDWYVDRCGKQVRYVIDYYEGVPEGDNPVFNLVVRPAIDDFGSLADRAKQLWDDAKEKYFK